MTTANGVWRFFGLVLVLSLPFYALGVTGAALPFASALPLSALGAVVPMIAALLLIWRQGGHTGIKTLLAKAHDFSGVTGFGWVIAAGFMPAAFALTAGLVWLSGTPLPALQVLPVSAIIPAFALFFVGAVGEEMGWQGYAYPALKKHHSALTAALVIGIAGALWHVIPFALMGRDAGWIFWQSLVIVLMRISIVWLFLNTGQNILIAVLFHMMSNSVWGIFTYFTMYYDPMLMCVVLLTSVTAVVALLGPTTRRWFKYGLATNPRALRDLEKAESRDTFLQSFQMGSESCSTYDGDGRSKSCLNIAIRRPLP